eukprot:m51a1_g7424 putative pas domain-containing protein tyrosine kinase (515) ;mRNA; f:25747-27899
MGDYSYGYCRGPASVLDNAAKLRRQASSACCCTTSPPPGVARPQADSLDWRDITIVRRIGGGHFGTVLNGSAKEDVAASWVREVGVLRTLRHPNCVLFLGACSSPQGPMIATEYLSFGSLHAWLSDPAQRVTRAQAVAAAQQSAQGMRYLHEQRPPVLHKDLTSSNILVDASGCVKIADFGLSTIQRATAKSAGSEYLTNIRWRAPEVTSTHFETASDVFSWGLVLYEIQTRTLPYSGLSDSEAHRRIVQGDLPPFPPNSCRLWSALFNKCCSIDPAARPLFLEITDEILEIEETLSSLKSPVGLSDIPLTLPEGVCFANIVSTIVQVEKGVRATDFKDIGLIKENCECWIILSIPDIGKITVITLPRAMPLEQWSKMLRPAINRTRAHLESFTALPIMYCPGEAVIFDLKHEAKRAEVIWFIADVLDSRDRNIPEVYSQAALPYLRSIEGWCGCVIVTSHSLGQCMICNLFSCLEASREFVASGKMLEHLTAVGSLMKFAPMAESYSVNDCFF